jgi:hypothetical protein
MQFSDGAWFDFDQGLTFNLGPDKFTKLNFRAKQFVVPTRIEFYAGNAQIADSRLNIVRDPNHYQVFDFQVRETVVRAGPITIAGGATVAFAGTGAAGSGYGYRKEIIVTNLDPASDLDLLDSANNPIGTVFFRQANIFETSATVKLKNNGAGAMAIRVMEIFYPE